MVHKFQKFAAYCTYLTLSFVSEHLVADQFVYLHQTKPILLERENEFSLSLNVASSKHFDESRLGSAGEIDKSDEGFSTEGISLAIKPISKLELGVELSNVFSERNMYLLASLYETPQMAMTASFAYAHYRFLGERIIESEQRQYDYNASVIFKGTMENLRPYLGLGLRQYKITNNGVYYDEVNSVFVDKSISRTRYSFFFNSGFTYYIRGFIHAVRLEHSLSSSHFSGDDGLNSSFQIELSWESDLW